MVFTRFESRFGNRELGSVTPDEVLSFLTHLTDGRKQSTKRSRYAALSAFFSLIESTLDPQIQNPCKTTMLKKLFGPAKAANRRILEKETVDEIIFRTPEPRNRIILELMARGGMRIGEVLWGFESGMWTAVSSSSKPRRAEKNPRWFSFRRRSPTGYGNTSRTGKWAPISGSFH
jgi:hypothetical protein